MRASTALAFVFSTVLAFPVAAQPVTGGGRPPPPPQMIPLGGHVTYGPESFELLAPKGPRAACSSPPFEAQEIERVAPARLFNLTINRPGQRPSITRSVKLDARLGGTAQTIPLTTYLAQLNAAEQFYNAHGLTLRRGVLKATPRRLSPGVRLALPPCVSRDDMRVGTNAPLIRYRLIDAPKTGNGLQVDPGSVPGLKPNPRGPGDVMTHPIEAIGYPSINPADLTLEGKKRYGSIAVATPSAPGTLGVMTPMSGSACPVECTYEFEKTAWVTPEAQLLIDKPDEVIYTKYTCDILTSSANNSENCPKIHKHKVSETMRRQDWQARGLDVAYFLANYKKVCDVLKKVGNFPRDSLYKLNGASKGNETVQTGTAATSFFDGNLAYKNTGIADCVLQMGSSNSLFGAQFCLRYSTDDRYSPAKGYQVQNTAGMVTGVTLFGTDFNLVDGDAVIGWKQPAPLPKGPPYAAYSLTSTMQAIDETKHFEGPGAFFTIGPVPVSIRTFAEASLSGGKPEPLFKAPAMAPGVAGTGYVGLKLGGETDVSVGMEAAVDAIVLKAGVSGKLSVLNNSVTGRIQSDITPANKELTVTKEYLFESTALKGSISAFVEVDVLIYSERYEIEIVSFPGITYSEPLQTQTWGPVKAVIPSTASSNKACPK